jgi:small subunit ribosomal protein S19
MARSLKKGPYVEPKLLDRIEDMNKRGEKRVIKT